MNVKVSVSMSLADFLAVHVIEPVVCNDLTRYIEYQPAERIPLVSEGDKGK